MSRVSKWVLTALATSVLLLVAGAAQAQTTTTTQKVNFEVISVDGNKVVYRGDQGVREVTLTPDFKLEMDGKTIGIADIKPGMKGTAMVTTKTTTTPVTVTEVRNADVLSVVGSTVIVRGDDNIVRKYTIGDVRDRNITIMKDGERIEPSQLRVGDKLTATIITRQPPKVVTEREINAKMAPAPAPAAKSAPAPAPAPAPAASSAPPASSSSTTSASTSSSGMSSGSSSASAEGSKKKLPKTGSDLPLLALLGGLSLATGLGLTTRRVSRTAR